MSYLILSIIRSYITYPIFFLDMIYHVRSFIFMLIMKHLSVVCAIEYVLETFLKPKLFKSINSSCKYKKKLLFETQCFLVPFLANLVLVLTLKPLEISLSLITFEVHLFSYTSIHYNKSRGWRNNPLTICKS